MYAKISVLFGQVIMQSRIPRPSQPIEACRRCGTCCAKGGPALHLVDQALVRAGVIPLKHLFSIRAGEPVWDNVRRCIAAAAGDIIKIGGAANQDRPCIFFTSGSNTCAIYQQRPLECRTLACWDTAALEAIYSRDRLTRRELFATVAGLWELISDHQARCDYHLIRDAADRLRETWSAPLNEQLLAMIRYDFSLREEIRQRWPEQTVLLDLFFGRPLTHTLGRFGLRLAREKEELVIRIAEVGVGG